MVRFSNARTDAKMPAYLEPGVSNRIEVLSATNYAKTQNMQRGRFRKPEMQDPKVLCFGPCCLKSKGYNLLSPGTQQSRTAVQCVHHHI